MASIIVFILGVLMTVKGFISDQEGEERTLITLGITIIVVSIDLMRARRTENALGARLFRLEGGSSNQKEVLR